MKRILIAMLLVSSLLFSGCALVKGDYSYKNSDKYSPFDGEIRGEFTSLDIGWLDGNVVIEKGEKFSVSESLGGADSQYCLYYLIDGDTLHIRYVKSKTKFKNDFKKDLKITVPNDLDKIEADIVSANVHVNGLVVNEMEINTVSGDVNIANSIVNKADMDFVSSNISLENVLSDKIDLDGISGDLIATFNKLPKELDLDTVSGNVKLTLPENSSFTVDFDTVSGNQNIEFPCSVINKKYVVGGGDESNIKFHSVSGDLKIKVNK